MSTENILIKVEEDLQGEDLEALIAVDEVEAEDDSYRFISLE